MMLTRQGGQEKDGSWHSCSPLVVKEEDSQLPGHRRWQIWHGKYEMSMKFFMIEDMNSVRYEWRTRPRWSKAVPRRSKGRHLWMGLKFSTLSTSVSKSSLEAPGPSTGVPAGGTEGEAGAAVRAASVTVQAHLHQNFRISRVSVFLETCGSLLPIIDEVQTGHSSSSRSSSFRSLASAMTEIRLDLFREENLDFFLFHLNLLIQFIKYLLWVIKKVYKSKIGTFC